MEVKDFLFFLFFLNFWILTSVNKTALGEEVMKKLLLVCEYQLCIRDFVER